MNTINEFNQVIGYPITNWQFKEKPSKQKLLGSYCTLERLDIKLHAKQLFHSFSIENDGSSWTYLPYGPFATIEAFCQWLSATLKSGDAVLYAILDKEGIPVGIAGYLKIIPEHGSIEIGHVHFSKLLQKTPAATESIFLLMSYIFNELGYRRCEWKCDALNQPSRNAAQRVGFTFEGIFRQCNVFKNRNRDTAWFSIIDLEWPEIECNLTKWLNPDNFNAQGQQKQSLNGIKSSIIRVNAG